MPKIRLLDQTTVNMIAAGEVIERPASVVKELLENSLDAGATHISVLLEQGGKRQVAVIDDGCGMEPEDLLLAFEPHATSKVSSPDDLARISTFGFRGEALASIAAVSQIRAVSKTNDNLEAYCLEIDCGQKGQIRPCSGNKGTAIYVFDLFYRVPARQRFLKSVHTEMDHIVEQFIRISLGVYGMGGSGPELILMHNGRPIYRLERSQALGERIRQLFGQLAPDGSLVELTTQAGDVKVYGMVGLPQVCRPTGRLQYIFLNGRYIRDRLITHAIRQGYEDLLGPDSQPAAFLYIQMDPGSFDVNVHPAKMEVRFYRPDLVHNLVRQAIRDALTKGDMAVPVRLASSAVQQGPGQVDGQQDRVRNAIADYMRSHTRQAGQVQEPTGLYTSRPPQQAGPRRFMQVHDAYIVVQTPDGLEIVDQHALHEMVLYNTICGQLDKDGLVSQRMLIEPVVKLSTHQMALVEAHKWLIRKLGIELAQADDGAVRIVAFPSLLGQVDPVQFLLEVLEVIDEHIAAQPSDILDAIAAMAACKAAVKAGQRLSDQEIEALVADGLLKPSIKRCPHGRPTGIRLTLEDLRRQFLRV
ncbi:MAG: DNA mismatch repair endonuclease MutL [Sedimentisphaerales bacterium]|jgi:DNA mismatch repair protein MutL|nr:DNA mismatch repair endonuclease MutL [Sedimentisphaerales bacterium]